MFRASSGHTLPDPAYFCTGFRPIRCCTKLLRRAARMHYFLRPPMVKEHRSGVQRRELVGEGKKTILVVEDSADARALMRSLLLRQGYDVAMANDGLEALAYLEANPRPALILLDLRMPIMDGLQFLEHQSQRPAIADLPVVVYSAEHIPVVAAPNVVGCVQKASGCRTVLDVIQRALGD